MLRTGHIYRTSSHQAGLSLTSSRHEGIIRDHKASQDDAEAGRTFLRCLSKIKLNLSIKALSIVDKVSTTEPKAVRASRNVLVCADRDDALIQLRLGARCSRRETQFPERPQSCWWNMLLCYTPNLLRGRVSVHPRHHAFHHG